MSDREDFEEAARRLGISLQMRDVDSEDGKYWRADTSVAWDMWQEATSEVGSLINTLANIRDSDFSAKTLRAMAGRALDTGITVSEIEQKAEPVAWLCLWPDGSSWGAVTEQHSVDVWMRRESEGRTVCPLYTQPQSADVEEYPNCDTCGAGMNYMPWHYSTETERHLHSCDQCWPLIQIAAAPQPQTELAPPNNTAL